jgi:CDP-glucose 4,6-dehydratase
MGAVEVAAPGLPSPAFWNGRRVFLTGHTGFTGTWFVLALHHLGATVTGYSLDPPTHPSLFDEVGAQRLCTDCRGDVRDRAGLARAFEQSGADVLFHLAAQPIVRYAFSNPLETYEVNAIGTLNMLDVVRTGSAPAVAVFITTDKVYENREWCWPYRETEDLGGDEPYAASKACAELIIRQYRQTYFDDRGPAIPIVVARAGNIIGGGDWAENRIVPDAARAWTRGEVLNLRNPSATRPWQHVLDAISGYLLLAERATEDPRRLSRAWNIGPSVHEAVTVGELVSMLSEAWGDDAKYEVAVDAGATPESQALNLDTSMIRRELGWRPVWSLQETVDRTAQWYRDHHMAKSSAVDLTLGQIGAFFDA